MGVWAPELHSGAGLKHPFSFISAPPPPPQPSSRGIVGRRLRQLRYCVATFPHSASHSLQSCSFVRVCLSVVGRPSCVRMPSLQQNCSARILHSAAASLTHKSCGTLTRPAVRSPAAPCCQQTGVFLSHAAAAPGKHVKASSSRLFFHSCSSIASWRPTWGAS